ncbi:EamA family transporter [Oleidesulfovibrio sp.]|uniref:EamA family transporter n=1 Tax=Oleidesulfovibrio sp. TaxID=2909707 RepID=UPI003A8784BF
MLWFSIALATAFFSAGEAAIIKRYFGDRPPYEMIVWPMGWSLPLFLSYLAFAPVPVFLEGFWAVMFIMLPLNMVALLIQTWAIRLSPISLTVPFLSFTPAFMLLTGWLILGEAIPLQGALGIICIVAGSWLLNKAPEQTQGNAGLWLSVMEPFKAATRERGSMLMLLASLIWSVTAVLSKKLALLGTPMYTAALFFALHNGILLALIFAFTHVSPRILLQRPVAGASAGLCMFGQVVLHFQAITLVAAAYMIAVKRLNGLISVVLGRMIFNEKISWFRGAGALMMGLGAAVIAFSS